MFDLTGFLEGLGEVTGLAVIGTIIFAESGLLVGFFLPGDTLLFTAGFFAAQGKLPLVGVLVVIAAASFTGDNVGYTIGKKTGPKLFTKKDGIIFRQEYVRKAEAFYEKHGGKTIILARYVPIVRTFAPLVAGVGNMKRSRFVLYAACGATVWTASVVLLGYFLGSLIDPHTMEQYILLVIGGAMAITIGPTLLHLLREPRLRAFVARQLSRVWRRLQRRRTPGSSTSRASRKY